MPYYRSCIKRAFLVVLFVSFFMTETISAQMTRQKSIDSAFGIFSGYELRSKVWFKSSMGWNSDGMYQWVNDHYSFLNAHWDRSNQSLSWDKIEPILGGGYDWDNIGETDSLITEVYASEAYVNWLGVFHQGGDGGSNARNPLEHPTEYKAFVKDVVERFDGDGVNDASPYVNQKYWQLGNESFEWFGAGRTVDEYVEWVRMTRSAALEADADAKIVLIAKIVSSPTMSSSYTNLMGKLAVSNEFDVIDLHYWESADEWKMDVLPLYRAFLDGIGMSHVQIWSCENATWVGTPESGPEQTEEEQAQSMTKRYAWGRANGLDKLMWNGLLDFYRFANNQTTIYNSMGLVTDGQDSGDSSDRINTARICYWTYKELAANTDNHVATMSGTVAGVHNESTIYAYEYTRLSDGGQVFIAWSESGAQTVAIPVSGNIYAVKNLVPNRFGEFEVEDAGVSGGQITVTLGSDPVLIKASSDSDGDGLSDELELTLGTDILKTDTDGDGLSDYEEVTGNNDASTLFNPGGKITDPLVVDEVFASELLASREWTKVWGSENAESATAIAIDAATNIFVAGYTEGAFDGQSNAGGNDMSLSKFDVQGNKLWSRLWGTTGSDQAEDITVDASGNVYVVGEVDGDALTGEGIGHLDMCVVKYSNAGEVIWTNCWGTTNADYGKAIALDNSGYIYITGTTGGRLSGQSSYGGYDFSLVKFDSAGASVWERQWGSANWDENTCVTVDGNNNIYVAGYTYGDVAAGTNCGCVDLCISKFDSDGNELWSKIWGSSEIDYIWDMAVDADNNVYVVGGTEGAIEGQTHYGSFDVFITKYNSSGTMQWTRQWGSSSADEAKAISIDDSGNLHIAGYTHGVFHSESNSGKCDMFVSVMAPDGTLLLTRIWGSADDDEGRDLAVDDDGNVYVAGNISGDLDGESAIGHTDLAVTKWSPLAFGYFVFNDYNGDGVSDFAVFDSNTGYWYVLAVDGTVVSWAVQWGWPGAQPVAGDYDGDRIADFAVFDTNIGYWYILSPAGDLLLWAQEWGWPGAQPVSGDYNGDRISDLAVFDTNTGYWYVLDMDGSLITWALQWGWPGANPVSGDYNGDGVSDYAVFDSNTGYWYVLSSGGSVITWALQWGWPGAEPVSGDYNGDGVSDYAVFDSNTGYWYVISSGGSVIAWAQEWGWPGAQPVTGDYNGDGVSDLAVFDTNTGYWYVLAVDGSVITWAQEWGWPGAITIE